MEQKFSVLMSVYAKDRPAWIKQALESVLTNTVIPSEVLIMVDGPVSKNIQNILDEAAQNKTVRVIKHPVNIGRGATLGIAVPQCNNELIALMDADDICLKDRFEKQISAFAADSDLAVLGGQIQEVDAETLSPLAKRTVPLTYKEIYKYLKTRMPFNNVTVMFKKAAVLEAGNYKAFGMLEDYYMWTRVIAKGYKTANLADVLVNVRINPAMYGRRGGYKYFRMNKFLFDEMLKLGLINRRQYYYTLTIRFIVQVLMPNGFRSMFYKRVLR